MMLNFIFSNLGTIVFSIWAIFFIFIVIWFLKPSLIKNISFVKLIIIAFSLNIIYGFFITWGQYYVWANSSTFTNSFINLPLPKEVPFNSLLEWTRPLFENNFGFFLFYSLGRFWLNIFILFLVSSIIYFIFRIWRYYRGNFSKNGPELILVLMLISGWPGLIVFISLGFLFSIFYFLFNYWRGKKSIEIDGPFIWAAFIALIFSRIIIGLL